MFNDTNRDDIKLLLEQRVRENPILSKYYKHYGFRALANVLGYKVDKAVKDMQSRIFEFYKPESERILLSKLMYELGYIRFQTPLGLLLNVSTKSDVLLEHYQKYTDGANLYIQTKDVYVQNGVPTEIEVELGTLSVKEVVIDKERIYYKIPLEKSYREVYRVELSSDNGEEIIYSQQFVKDESDYSLEIKLDGTLQIVVRLNNTNGSNIRYGDIVTAKIYSTIETNEEPTSLSILHENAPEIEIKDVTKIKNYKRYMDLEEMSDILLYNKNINNTLIYNEDYRRYLVRWIPGIKELKVWHEQDEIRENGSTPCIANAVFISYISIDNMNLNNEIENIIANAVYGKNIIIKEPILQSLGVRIKLTNNIRRRIPLSTISKIKSLLTGTYDDIYNQINKETIYSKLKKNLDVFNVDVSIDLSDKGIFQNQKFYEIKDTNITIDIEERF